ncbi:MAG: pyrF [Candidatus Kaiserbacteria bacterium]|nr:pyrF [Candidatus Kaiserbacteria bacterium]
MSKRNFMELIEAKWNAGKFVCLGLDSELKRVPREYLRSARFCRGAYASDAVLEFNKIIVDMTHNIVGAYKPNAAYYETLGDHGMVILRKTIEYINEVAPDVPVIYDAKRADIGNTNRGYVVSAFEKLCADAITVNPYFGGEEALSPFLAMKDKGIIVLCRTSNSGAGELQDLPILIGEREAQMTNFRKGTTVPFYQFVAARVSRSWNKNGNCALVVGATAPHELGEVRNIVGEMPILVPGIGTQGGDIAATLTQGLDACGQGLIINSSSGLIFADNGPDFAEATRRATFRLHQQIGDIRTIVLEERESV